MPVIRRQMSDVRGAHPGVTLLELAVSVAIGTMILLILGGIFLAQGKYFAIEDATSETQIHAFRAIDTAGLYMSSAQAILASQTINGTVYTSGTTTVVIKMPSIDGNGNIIPNTYDYAAIGQDPLNSGQFMYDIQSAPGSSRINGKYAKAQLVDTVIFRYNAVNATAARAVDLYIRTKKNARGRTIYMPLGKVYYLGAN